MLAGDVRRLEKQIQSCSAQLGPLHQRIAGLDTTMRLFDSTVRPDAGGIVNAHAGKYGVHGGLTRYVEEEMKAAGRQGIDNITLASRTAVRFQVDLPTRKDLRKYKQNTLGPILRDLRSKKLIELVFASPGGRVPSVWRWKTAPSLADIAMQARLQSAP